MSGRWLERNAAARALGMARGTLDRLAASGQLRREQRPRAEGEVRGGWRYWVEDPEPEPEALAHTEQRHEGERYVYARDPDGTEHYVLTLRTLGGQSVIWPAERVRAIWRAYVGGAQIAEVCREFEISRPVFNEVKAILGLTKTSAPWPPEHIEATHEDELVHDATAAKTQRVLVRAERQHWSRMARAAEQWMTGPEAILEQIRHVPVEPVEIDASPRPESEHVVVLGLSDVHIGKRPHGGISSPREQRDRVARLAERAIAEALRWGAPARWYVHCGGDLLQVDTASYTTTRGTPQGGQTTGSVVAAWRAAVELMAGVIEECARTAPVVVPVVPGNHDWMLSITVGGALEQRYRGASDVRVDVGDLPRRCYVEWGVPLLFDHGDSIKAPDYPTLLAASMPTGADIRRGVVIRGHWHSAAHQERLGVDVVTMPSSGPVDDWHAAHWYVHRPRIGVYRIGRAGLECSALVS